MERDQIIDIVALKAALHSLDHKGMIRDKIDAAFPLAKPEPYDRCDWFGYDGERSQCNREPTEVVNGRYLCPEHAAIVRQRDGDRNPTPPGDGSRGSVANTLSVVREMVEAGDPTPPGDGIDERVYEAVLEAWPVVNWHVGPPRDAIAAAVRKDRELRGDDDSDWIYVVDTEVKMSGCLSRELAVKVINKQAALIRELGGAEACGGSSRRASSVSEHSQSGTYGEESDAPPATEAALTDEELVRIYDMSGVSGIDGHLDGRIPRLRAVARAQHAKSGVVVCGKRLSHIMDTDGWLAVLKHLESIGVTVEDEQ